MSDDDSNSRRLSLGDLSAEPFRLFFPAAVLAGLLGALAWPLHFGGVLPDYPNISHARLMAHGFFGGFIFGFLGTSLPRMLTAPKFSAFEVGLLLSLHLACTACHFLGNTFAGDWLFCGLLLVFAVGAMLRFKDRRDVPPPGFVLVALAWLCALSGTIIALIERRQDIPFELIPLQRLLAYQGFVMLPILGVGGFILPRFLDLPNRHDFPESRTPPPGWTPKALMAGVVGAAVVFSFFLEAHGKIRAGHALRLAFSAAWLLHEVPIHRSRVRKNALASGLRIAFVLFLLGLLAIAIHPAYRVAFLHLSLVGGFGIITLVVATRVVFGHSGNLALLQARNRWFTTSVVLMLIALATRITADFVPKIMISHYVYGAVFWTAALLVWTAYVIPKVLKPDPDED